MPKRPFKIKIRPSIARLHEVFVCDGEAGTLIRKRPRRNSPNPTGTVSTNGYLQTAVNGRLYHVHVIIWAMCTGSWPEIDLDHINGVKLDNRMANLRLATRSQNCGNQKIRCTNSAGLKGAYPRGNGRWRSVIMKDGKRINIGSFGSAEEAHAAYLVKAAEIFGEFACRDGRVSAPLNGA